MVFDLFLSPIQTSNDQEKAARFLTTTGKVLPPFSFHHDGCTLFPDTLPWHDFTSACFEHDLAYWAGGTQDERVAADKKFREALNDVGFFGPTAGFIAYYGVRMFGDSPVTRLLDAEWGYGWDD